MIKLIVDSWFVYIQASQVTGTQVHRYI